MRFCRSNSINFPQLVLPKSTTKVFLLQLPLCACVIVNIVEIFFVFFSVSLCLFLLNDFFFFF